LVGLSEKKGSLIGALSRGMQQRLGLARVLIHDPQLLLLDEPASGLDPRARIEMRELLRELKRMGKTIMISSHILSELEEICDRIGIIEHGQLVFSGTLEEIRPRLGIQSKVRVKVLGNETRALELLSVLPQIQSVELIANQTASAGLTPEAAGSTLLVTFKEGATSDGLIARTLVTGGVDLVYLQPEQFKLDDAFLQLTKGIVH
jgi:ABC-2 type transport system ATP-binding protein